MPSNNDNEGDDANELEAAEILRSNALKLGRSLVWHATNTPLSSWRKATSGIVLPWPHGLFHVLYNNRPKRPATPTEIVEITRRMIGMGLSGEPSHVLDVATDPDWALFSLPQVPDDEPQPPDDKPVL